MTPAFSLCVYCGSRSGSRPAFSQAALALGEWIGRHQGQLVYGGGKNGLMGLVAQATLQAGGRVIGIIPQALVERELAHRECHELHVVDTMHERKRRMAELSDAFVALPGGIGTFEELFEIWAWRQLGYHDKPIGLLNIEGYYDPLLSFLNSSVEQTFMGPAQMDLLRIGSDPQTLLPELIQSAGLGTASGLAAV